MFVEKFIANSTFMRKEYLFKLMNLIPDQNNNYNKDLQNIRMIKCFIKEGCGFGASLSLGTKQMEHIKEIGHLVLSDEKVIIPGHRKFEDIFIGICHKTTKEIVYSNGDPEQEQLTKRLVYGNYKTLG